MRKPTLFAAFIVLALCFAGTLHAASFVVPADRGMVPPAHLIVSGSAVTSYTQLTPAGGVETVTPISVEDVISGKNVPDMLNVVEPGGRHGDTLSIIPGSPQFEPGERVLLMLRR